MESVNSSELAIFDHIPLITLTKKCHKTFPDSEDIRQGIKVFLRASGMSVLAFIIYVLGGSPARPGVADLLRQVDYLHSLKKSRNVVLCQRIALR